MQNRPMQKERYHPCRSEDRYFFRESCVIILSEVTQRYIHSIISLNDWNYSQTAERFVLVMTDSVSSQSRRR
jgi:hypothetical protein